MRSKLLVATAIAGTLALSSFGTASAKGHATFQDLGHAQWAAAAIETLSAQGVLTGLTPTQFGPQDPVTIGQLAAVLLRYQGGAGQGAPFAKQVQRAIGDGMLSGLGGDVDAGAAATRAQAIAMIVNALQLPANGNLASLQTFGDTKSVPAWARQPLALAVQLGLLTGSQGQLDPNAKLSRAELAVILQRIELELGLGHAATVQGTFAGAGSVMVNGQPLATITLRAFGGSPGQETYTLAPNAQIDYGNVTGSLASFAVGDQVMLTLTASGQADVVADLTPSRTVEANPGVVSGIVTSLGGGRITIAAQNRPKGRGKKGGSQSGTYVLSPTAKVVIPGEGAHGSLAEITAGTFVRLVVGPSGLVDMIIAQVSPVPGGGTLATSTPTQVAASEVVSGIALSWNGVAGATSYQVLVASGGGYSPVSPAEGGAPVASDTTVAGLTVGSAYTFEVEAVTSSGASQPSAPTATVTWGAKPATAATVSVAPSPTGDYATITVSYDKALNPLTLDQSPSDYQVVDESQHTQLGVASVSASGQSVTIVTVPTALTTLPTDLLGITTTRSIIDDAADAPTTPIAASGSQQLAGLTGLSAQETAGGIYLTWSPIAGASTYQVLEASGGAYSPVSQANGGTPASAGTAITGLAVGASYTFEVEAVTQSGLSAPSAPSTAVEWGARSATSLTTTVTEVAGDEEFTLAIPYDKPLDGATLDRNLGDYTVTDLTTHVELGVASVALVGQTLLVQTTLSAPIPLTDGIEVATGRPVVNDAVGAPTTPLAATGSL